MYDTVYFLKEHFMVTYKGYIVTQNIQLVKEKKAKPFKVNGPDEIYRLFQSLSKRPQEELYSVTLDNRMFVIGIDRLSMGSMNSSLAHPREIYRLAILQGATSICLVHNHPSGDPSPSDDDIRLTNRIIEAGKLLGIPLLDHIIIGENTSASIMDGSKVRPQYL